MSDKWLEGYDGQSTDELLALEGEYRTDSLVVAFEQAIQMKRGELSREESFVLAVEALEREVNNGGYVQFFLNSSREHIGIIEQALRAIGCEAAAAITHDAIRALNISGVATPDAAEQAVLSDDDAVREALAACDDRYFSNDEPIGDRLFAWIRASREAIRLGDAQD